MFLDKKLLIINSEFLYLSRKAANECPNPLKLISGGKPANKLMFKQTNGDVYTSNNRKMMFRECSRYLS